VTANRENEKRHAKQAPDMQPCERVGAHEAGLEIGVHSEHETHSKLKGNWRRTIISGKFKPGDGKSTQLPERLWCV